MRELSVEECNSDSTQRLLKGVTFYREIAGKSSEQFDRLISLSTLVEAEPGEEVIQQGDVDTCLYFLLKGQLAVLGDDKGSVLNYISPGEIFGTLSMIMKTPRTATIVGDENSKSLLLSRIDFEHFSDIEDFVYLDLDTKLAFYRLVNHNIRWTLEVNRMENPSHELVAEVRKVPLYTGAKDSPMELAALKQQAFSLADILCRWNDAKLTSQGNVQVT